MLSPYPFLNTCSYKSGCTSFYSRKANQNKLKAAIQDFHDALQVHPSHRNGRKYLCETLVSLAKQLVFWVIFHFVCWCNKWHFSWFPSIGTKSHAKLVIERTQITFLLQCYGCIVYSIPILAQSRHWTMSCFSKKVDFLNELHRFLDVECYRNLRQSSKFYVGTGLLIQSA